MFTDGSSDSQDRIAQLLASVRRRGLDPVALAHNVEDARESMALYGSGISSRWLLADLILRGIVDDRDVVDSILTTGTPDEPVQTPPSVGDEVRPGAWVLQVQGDLVVCGMPRNHATPYVVWRWWRHSDGTLAVASGGYWRSVADAARDLDRRAR